MGRLSEYFRSHRPGLGFSIAEGVLKSSATVLLLASLALVAFDGFVLVALRLMVPEDAARSVATDIKDALEHTPWILWAFLASGVAAFLVGVLGLAAAHARSLAVLNLFLFLQAALLIYQACLAALSFKRSVWDGALPPPSDTSPAAAHVRAFLEARLPLFQASGPLLLGLQAVSLTGAACVQSYYLAAHEAMDEEPEDEVWSRRRTTAGTRGGKSSAVARAAAAPQRRPLLPPAGSPEAPRSGSPTALLPPRDAPPRTDEWSVSMMRRYGLNTANFTYVPLPAASRGEGAPPSAGRATPSSTAGGGSSSSSRAAQQDSRKSCAVM